MTSRPRQYTARLLTSLPVWEFEGMSLKPYWIDAMDEAEPPAELLSAAKEMAAATLPGAAAAEGESTGLGFAVLHRGYVGTWLLMNWWAHGYMCCQEEAKAAPGSTSFATADEHPVKVGIWTMAVMWREREAWISTMMSGEPHPDAYLRKRINDGWY